MDGSATLAETSNAKKQIRLQGRATKPATTHLRRWLAWNELTEPTKASRRHASKYATCSLRKGTMKQNNGRRGRLSAVTAAGLKRSRQNSRWFERRFFERQRTRVQRCSKPKASCTQQRTHQVSGPYFQSCQGPMCRVLGMPARNVTRANAMSYDQQARTTHTEQHTHEEMIRSREKADTTPKPSKNHAQKQLRQIKGNRRQKRTKLTSPAAPQEIGHVLGFLARLEELAAHAERLLLVRSCATRHRRERSDKRTRRARRRQLDKQESGQWKGHTNGHDTRGS